MPSLEELVGGAKTLEESEAILEQNIKKPLEQEESLQQVADRLAKTLLYLSTTRHDASKELEQDIRIEEHILRVKQLELRDAKRVRDLIRGLTMAEISPIGVNEQLNNLINEMSVQNALLEKINDILKKRDVERYESLVKLIDRMLVSLRNAKYHLSEAEKRIFTKEQMLKQTLKQIGRA